jgi:hypothetical protein
MPYGRILGFLDRRRYFSSKQLLNCTHEAEWTPFQTHYFSENLLAPGIEPGPLDLNYLNKAGEAINSGGRPIEHIVSTFDLTGANVHLQVKKGAV